MTQKMFELKSFLKSTAKEIHDTKATRKQDKRPAGVPLWAIQGKIDNLKSDFRYRHIAYCMLRGRTYEQIEPKTAENNVPNMDIVNKFIRDYTEEPQALAA